MRNKNPVKLNADVVNSEGGGWRTTGKNRVRKDLLRGLLQKHRELFNIKR